MTQDQPNPHRPDCIRAGSSPRNGAAAIRAVPALAAFFLSLGAQASASAPAELMLESLEFSVATTMKAVTVRGTAKVLNGATVLENEKPTRVEATVPIESLETGLSLRDRHMREKIFQTADGKTPALHFISERIDCASPSECTKDCSASCQVTGALTIRAMARPSLFQCRILRGAAECESSVKLSDYSIERPSQLGITVADEVSLRLKLRKK